MGTFVWQEIEPTTVTLHAMLCMHNKFNIPIGIKVGQNYLFIYKLNP
jgi:hypothetical protein